MNVHMLRFETKLDPSVSKKVTRSMPLTSAVTMAAAMMIRIESIFITKPAMTITMPKSFSKSKSITLSLCLMFSIYSMERVFFSTEEKCRMRKTAHPTRPFLPQCVMRTVWISLSMRADLLFCIHRNSYAKAKENADCEGCVKSISPVIHPFHTAFAFTRKMIACILKNVDFHIIQVNS